MGLIEIVMTWWVTGPLLAVIGALYLAFARCAIAEVAVRLAARLYGATPAAQERWREEWLGILEDMKASERPAHAGTLLWRGVGALTIRRVTAWSSRSRQVTSRWLEWGGLASAAISNTGATVDAFRSTNAITIPVVLWVVIGLMTFTSVYGAWRRNQATRAIDEIMKDSQR